MALINKVSNTASITYDGKTINSNKVDTLLLLAPTIVKAVDKLSAAVGSTLTYTITITNLALGAITNLPFSDSIPDGTTYVADSFTVNGTKVTPTVTSKVLTYTIPTIPSLGVSVVKFDVQVTGGETS